MITLGMRYLLYMVFAQPYLCIHGTFHRIIVITCRAQITLAGCAARALWSLTRLSYLFVYTPSNTIYVDVACSKSAYLFYD